jgi:putative hydrolase of the HAD superfamily
VNFPVRAITLERKLHAWMEMHSPQTAARFPIEEMRALRECVVAEYPEHAHDLSLLRRLTIERALRDSGGDIALAEAAYAIFFAERNRVEFYPDAPDALRRIAARVPVAAVSNGNADLAAIGIDAHFRFQLGAREHGAAKPSASIFHAACERLRVAPSEVLHVGDDIEMDVVGAARAGLRTCWLDREGLPWPHADLQPDLHFTSLAALADWLDAQPSNAQEEAAA